MTLHQIPRPLIGSLLSLASAGALSGQLQLADNFDIAANDSVATGFGTDGVNTEVATRLTGALTTTETLNYFLSRPDKVDTSYSITGNGLQVGSADLPGVFEFSNDGSGC